MSRLDTVLAGRSADDELPVAVMLSDTDGAVVDVNTEWEALTGLSREASLGEGWLDALDPRDRRPAQAYLRRKDGWLDRREADWRLSGGVVGNQWVHVRVRVQRDEEGREIGHVIAVIDITDRKVEEARLDHLASHDDLTGLLNRNRFVERVEHALRPLGRRHTVVAVLFLDLDGFKAVNDHHGHEMGDRLLIEQAWRLQAVLRPSDTVARFGGDEFVILCEDLLSAPEACLVAERVISTVSAPVSLGKVKLSVGASVGIAVAGTADTEAEELLRRADHAMYRAKEGDRGWALAGGHGRLSASSSVAPAQDAAALELEVVNRLRDELQRVEAGLDRVRSRSADTGDALSNGRLAIAGKQVHQAVLTLSRGDDDLIG